MQNSEIGKLYIGCSLTNAPPEFVEEVGAFKDVLRQDFDLYDFVGTTNGTPEDVYDWDIRECVNNAGLFVGVCDFPAIGLGWEFGFRDALSKPSLALVHQDQDPFTRLVIGAARRLPHVDLDRYKHLVADGPDLVRQAAGKFALM